MGNHVSCDVVPIEEVIAFKPTASTPLPPFRTRSKILMWRFYALTAEVLSVKSETTSIRPSSRLGRDLLVRRPARVPPEGRGAKFAAVRAVARGR